jgi:hypothetical protein
MGLSLGTPLRYAGPRGHSGHDIVNHFDINTMLLTMSVGVTVTVANLTVTTEFIAFVSVRRLGIYPTFVCQEE